MLKQPKSPHFASDVYGCIHKIGCCVIKVSSCNIFRIIKAYYIIHWISDAEPCVSLFGFNSMRENHFNQNSH